MLKRDELAEEQRLRFPTPETHVPRCVTVPLKEKHKLARSSDKMAAKRTCGEECRSLMFYDSLSSIFNFPGLVRGFTTSIDSVELKSVSAGCSRLLVPNPVSLALFTLGYHQLYSLRNVILPFWRCRGRCWGQYFAFNSLEPLFLLFHS